MKKILTVAAIILTASTVSFAQKAQDGKHKHMKTVMAKKYACPMHPEINSNKPGQCSKCGMDLILVKKKAAKPTKAMGKM